MYRKIYILGSTILVLGVEKNPQEMNKMKKMEKKEMMEKVENMVAALRAGDMDVVERAHDVGLEVIPWGDELFHPMEHEMEILVDLMRDDVEKALDAILSCPKPCIVLGDWGLCGEFHARLVAWKGGGMITPPKKK